MKGRSIVKIIKGIPRFCARNSNWLLTGLAILGVTGLTWAAIDGTIKAVKLCEEKQVQGAKEVIKTTWKLYIPAAGFFILTTVAVCGNAHINAKRLATLTGLYAASQSDLQAFKKKVSEMVGEKKEKEIQAEADKEKIEKLPEPNLSDIAETGHGNQLFMDNLTGQLFRASPDYIELVEKDMNLKIQNEVDNTLFRGYMQEKFCERECFTKNLFWDYCQMLQEGHKEITLDCSYTTWIEINGQKETVAVVRCEPEATGY